MEDLDLCPSCGKKHGKLVLLNIVISKEAITSLKLIQNKLSCACQAAQPGAIPDGTPKEKAEAFIAAALASKAEAQWLQQLWWDDIIAKYDLRDKGNVNLDFITGDLFIYKETTAHE